LLCERLPRVDLIGVGINVNAGRQEAPAELRERIVSLRELTGNEWDLTDILGEVSHEVNRTVVSASAGAAREMRQEYASHHWPTGKYVELIDTDRAPRIAGLCLGIDEQGRLLVKTNQGSHALFTGSILSVTPAADSDRSQASGLS
jgi:biotin-(acetyl-CoA carboxylase) ligase